MTKITKLQNGCNCYIVEQGENAILIDPGMKAGASKVIEACRGKKIRMILITHGHVDHIEGVAEIAASLQVPIAMNQKDISLIESNMNQVLKGRTLFGKIMRRVLDKSMVQSQIQQFKPDILLNESTDLSAYGFEGKIIELPGHTDGSIALRMDDALFVGDTIMNFGKPGISMFYVNIKDLMDSVKRISLEGQVIIYPGHGKAVENREWSC